MACSEDVAYASAYPDLEELTFSILAQLDGQPLSFTFNDQQQMTQSKATFLVGY